MELEDVFVESLVQQRLDEPAQVDVLLRVDRLVLVRGREAELNFSLVLFERTEKKVKRQIF